MTHAPDLLLLSQYDPVMGEVAAFEELIGSHGGLGGPQTEPFILHPAEWELDEPVPLGAPGDLPEPPALAGLDRHRAGQAALRARRRRPRRRCAGAGRRGLAGRSRGHPPRRSLLGSTARASVKPGRFHAGAGHSRPAALPTQEAPHD